MNFVIDLVSFSGRVSERGIQRSVVRFLMGTSNFFLFPTLVTRRKKDLPLVLFWLRILDFIFRGSVLGFDH